MLGLTQEQIDQFIDKGWIRVRNAIPRDVVMEAQAELWKIFNQKFGITNDQRSWTSPFYQLSENYRHGVFKRCSTSKVMNSIKDLIGKDRLDKSFEREGIPFGWWPLNLSVGANEEWNVPRNKWHWDGLHFQSHIKKPEHGLLMFTLFSDVEPRGGGSLLAEGTHKLVVRFLKNFSDGAIEYKKDAIPLVDMSNPWLADLTGNIEGRDKEVSSKERIMKFMEQEYLDESGVKLRVIECTGKAGDVFLINPFIYRTGSQNHSGKPRIMSNFPVPLRDKINVNREGNEGYSILEDSIRLALS